MSGWKSKEQKKRIFKKNNFSYAIQVILTKDTCQGELLRLDIRYRPWQTVPAVVGAALPRECQDFPGGNFLVFSWQLQLLSLPKLLQRLLCNSQTQGDQVLKQSLNNFTRKMSSIAVYKHEILVQYLDFITRYIQYGAIKNQEKNYHFWFQLFLSFTYKL